MMPERRSQKGRRYVLRANKRGTEALVKGRVARAARAYQEAVAALTPAEDDLAGPVYENLGLAYLNQQRWRDAIPAFLRALDGVPHRREQSLRFVIACMVHVHLYTQALGHLRAYLDHFGPHPDGWTIGHVEQLRQNHRDQLARSMPC